MFSAFLAMAAEPLNLLKNPGFAGLDRPASASAWEVRATQTAGVQVIDGRLSVDTEKASGDVMLVQRYLAGGDPKMISADISGTGSFRIYVETKQRKDGREQSTAVNTAWNELTGGTRTLSFRHNPKDGTMSQLVLQVKAPAKLAFSGLSMTDIPGEERIQALGTVWKVNGDGKALITPKGRGVVLCAVSNYIPSGSLDGIAVEGGARYAFTCSLQGIEKAQTPTGFHGFQFRVVFPGVKEPVVSEWDDVWYQVPQRKQFAFDVPEGVRTCRLEMFVGSGSRISVLEPELKKLPPEAKKHTLTVLEPSFKNSFYETLPSRRILARVDGKAGAVSASLLSNGQVIAECRGEVGRPFSLPAETLTVGKAVLTVTVGEEVLTCDIHNCSRAKSEVIFDGNRRILVNGKPFLPRMFWNAAALSPRESEAYLDYAARHGVNLVIFRGSSAKQLKDYLDMAEKYGVMVLFGTSYASDDSPEGVEAWCKRIKGYLTKAVLEHPALFGYYMVDEPMWNGIPLRKLTESYKKLCEMDPYHPVFINAAPRGTIGGHRQYSSAADIYGVDVYPIPYGSHSGLDDKTPSCIGKYVQWFGEAVNFTKPVLMTLQGFAWSDLTGNPKAIYPTIAESRFMAYDAVTTTGGFTAWWGVEYVKNPDFYGTIFTVTRELAAMETWFLHGKKSIRTMGTVRIVDYQIGDSHCIVALNASTKPAVCSPVPQGIPVWFEKRNAGATESFAPFDVHIYSKEQAPELPETPAVSGVWGDVQRQLLNAVPYEGPACWIWDHANVKTPGSRSVLTRELTVTKPLKSARWYAASDDMATLFVDGRKVGERCAWKYIQADDVTSALQPGKHVLTADAADCNALPCGFIGQIELVYEDGSREVVPTDASWKTPDGVPAAIVAPANGGHWGKRIRVIKP